MSRGWKKWWPGMSPMAAFSSPPIWTSAVQKAEIVFIAVGTPPREDGSTDLSYVEDAAKGIARALNRYKVIVNKSTVPVGTGDFVRERH